jgi:hypothetical protein
MRRQASHVRRYERMAGEFSMATPTVLLVSVLPWTAWIAGGDRWALLGACVFTVLGLLSAAAWWLTAAALRDHDRGVIDLEDMP